MNITNTTNTPQPVEINNAPQAQPQPQVQAPKEIKVATTPQNKPQLNHQNQNQAQTQAQNQAKTKTQTEDFVKKISHSIESANIEINSHTSQIKFSMHSETNQVLGKVIDKETQEVIREFPPEEIVEMIAAMEQRAGLFVDTKK
ncbi:hypothetical protein AN396_14055 [Candidatus Epulonipiscium fishelsonii]|uniref:Uncharacterized protein n=1 Tax=Candidatus Epulonipiscium fishelsonii TaxID=77094 RepID=A0ACC8XGB1_9FIRM|nr:hypothetical protein AN396_14055 [Epulopiscium sp. SCG-B11WGA-EpuloA1]